MILEQFDVVGQVVEIPLDAIREAPDNVRSELGDLEELAASIAEVGLLQPITVIADVGGESFMVKTGHRRLAATRIVGSDTIRAIVDEATSDDARVIAMLIENVQRRDLSPIDEARTYERLIDEFGISQRDLEGRVSRSQSHISKRISLLDLPAVARDMLATGDLTIGDAVDLAKLAEHPDRLHKLLDEWPNLDAADRRYDLDNELEEVALEKKYATLVHELGAAGATILDETAAKKASRVVDPDAWVQGKQIEFTTAGVEKHKAEPCHAILLVRHLDGWTQRPYCTDPARHAPKGASKLKVRKTAEPTKRPPVEKSPEQTAADAAAKETLKARTAFATSLVREQKLPKGDVLTAALTDVALAGYEFGQRRTAELLGLDLTGRDTATAIADFAHGGHDNLLRAALAALINDAGTTAPRAQTLTLLERFGYQPSPAEAESTARDTAETDAFAALDRVIDRASELSASVDPSITALGDELEGEDEISTDRMLEIRALLDAKFAELNNLQEGDVVAQADDGTHTIERADRPAETAVDGTAKVDVEPVGDSAGITEIAPACVDRVPEPKGIAAAIAKTATVWNVWGAVGKTGSTTYKRPDPSDQVPAPELKYNDRTLQFLASFDHDPSELEVTEALVALSEERPAEPPPGLVDDTKPPGCDMPGCRKEHPHMGKHDFAPADDLELNTLLTGYSVPRPSGEYERKTRVLVAELPADDPAVIELQQELYRGGVSAKRMTEINRSLKTLKRDLGKVG